MLTDAGNQFASFLNLAADYEYWPLLFHCTAGKDRRVWPEAQKEQKRTPRKPEKQAKRRPRVKKRRPPGKKRPAPLSASRLQFAGGVICGHLNASLDHVLFHALEHADLRGEAE